MKMLGLLCVLSLVLVSCGKNANSTGSSSSTALSSAAFTQTEAVINTVSGAIEMGGVSYMPSQASLQIMVDAFNLAQTQKLQTFTENGVRKFRARIVARLATQTTTQTAASNLIDVQSAVIYN